jgi:precorrin-2 dehydrogenase/sirohydrochlorin ferrochelatase
MKNIIMVGSGRVGYEKILKFVEEQPKIKVFSRSSSAGVRKLYREGKVELINFEVKDVDDFLRGLHPKPDLVIAATDDPVFNAELATKAKAHGCMVYVIDNPNLSDFTFPASAEIGDVKIAISTGGKSPAMARILRRRIERIIKREDLLQIRLQSKIRKVLRKIIPNQKTRKQIIYEILHNKRIVKLLKEERFDEALAEAFNVVERYKPETELR